MSNIPQNERNLKELVIGKCWDYINDNFYKFTDTNKIKIALALLQKSMPTIVEGDTKGPQQIVIVRSKESVGDTTQELPRQVSVQQ